MKTWNRYGLGILFVAQWLLFTALYGVFLNLHQAEPSSFWFEFLAGVFENLQSEAFQVAALIIASAYLFYEGSQQSKEGQERIEAMLVVLLRKAADGDGNELTLLDQEVLVEQYRRGIPSKLQRGILE